MQGGKEMSKAKSHHYPRTYGSIIWNTSIVWKYIDITQNNYGGTELPESFNIVTSKGKLWTHNNATKHMHEAILSLKDNPMLKNTNPKLFTQFILFDYWQSLCALSGSELVYEKKVHSGSWEFVFSKPRKKGQNPVIKHAKFTGLFKNSFL